MSILTAYDHYLLRHKPPGRFPESPLRLKWAFNAINDPRISDGIVRVSEPIDADLSLLRVLKVHEPGYVRRVEELSARGGGWISGSTYVSEGAFDVCLRSVGLCLNLIDSILKLKGDMALALVRPPGHHARRDYGWGSCIFNNVAIAVRYALEEHGLERIAVLDLDAHHGDGIQFMFYEDPRVLYVSLHQEYLFPLSTGWVDEVGKGPSEGLNVNIPLPKGCRDSLYSFFVNEIACPLISEFEPDMMFIAMGFDTYVGDRLSDMELSLGFYHSLGLKIRRMGISPTLIALEGGYSEKAMHEGLANFISGLMGRDPLITGRLASPPHVMRKGMLLARSLKRLLRNYWHIT